MGKPTASLQAKESGKTCHQGRSAEPLGRKLVRAMKVLEGLKAIEPGTSVPVAELGLPVTGSKGLLLVFWKST
jgi:hypothetical protein